MITWTLKQTQLVFLETVDNIYEITEYDISGALEEEKSLFYFRAGKSYPDPYPKIRVLSRFFIPETEHYKSLPKARNFFEAQANLIEELIDQYCRFKLTPWVNGDYPMMLIRELGRQNLPLLINFFDEPNTIKALSEVLKE